LINRLAGLASCPTIVRRFRLPDLLQLGDRIDRSQEGSMPVHLVTMQPLALCRVVEGGPLGDIGLIIGLLGLVGRP
jgi:hypothetical protein